jgi:putative PEP-CTERM system TPR-repeat lipoprotein
MIQNTSHSSPEPLRILTKLAICAAVLLGGCSQESLTTEEHIQRAKDFSSQGKAQEAQIELRNALQQDPKNPQVHLLMAEMSMAIGNPYLAEVELKKARESGVAPEAIKVDMARALLMQGRAEDALKMAEIGANDSATNRLKLLEMRSRALMASGRLQDACAQVESMRALDPGSVLTMLGQARCAVAEKRDFSQAEVLLRAAIEKDKGNSEPWKLLGDIHLGRNQAQEAIDAYKNSLKQNPLQLDAHLKLTSIYVMLKRHDDAAAQIKAAKTSTPAPTIYHMQALLDYDQGRYTQARDSLTQVLKVMPDYLPSVLLGGMIEHALGSYEQAAKHLSRYLAQDPANLQAIRLLASAQMQLGQPDKALAALQPVLQSGRPVDATTYGLAGEIYLNMGDTQHAMEYLQKATALNPRDTSAQALLGRGYLAMGDSTRAITELQAAAQHSDKDGRADMALIAHHMQGREYDRALATIETLIKKRPQDAIAQNLRGLAYLGKKDYKNARASFQRSLELQPNYMQAVSGLARLDLLENKPADAKGRFESILAKDKNNISALMALANIAAMQRNAQGYEDLLRRAVAADAKALAPRTLLAEDYLLRKQPDKALAVAREALSANPENPDALGLMGRVQMAAGETDNALASFSKVVKLAPKSGLAHYHLGILQAATKKTEAARESLQHALALQPDHVKAAEALAMLDLSQGHGGEALQTARRLQQRNPKDPAGLMLEGDLLMRQDKGREAAKAYERAMALQPSSTTMRRLHAALVLGKNAPEADRRAMSWLATHPDDSALRGYFASDLAARKLHREAAQQYETLLRQVPNDAFALNNLAWIYHELRDSRALATAEAAHKLAPNNPEMLDTLGWLLVQQGQTARGLPLLEQAVKLGKGARPDIGFHLAATLARSGDKPGARKILEQVLQTKKPFPQQQEAKALMQQLR